MENKDFTIGESSNRLLTKEDLISLIEKNFADDKFGNIAVLTTAKSGDYKNRTIMQSLTISKILEM